jgi:hypothetical protein
MMATQAHQLVGGDKECFEGEFRLGALAVRARRLHGGLREGVLLVELVAGETRLFVLPDRGLGIWKMFSGSVEFGWHSPVKGPVHPSFVWVDEPSGLGWLAGFDELVCRCGLISNGAPEFDASGRLAYGLHGRIANLPADDVHVVLDDVAGTISLTGSVDETRFLQHSLRMTTTLTLRADRPCVAWTDRVENVSQRPAEIQMLYHCNFGQPLLGEGAELVAAVEELAPRDGAAVGDVLSWNRYAAPQAGRGEQVHFCQIRPDEDGMATAMLVAPSGEQAARLSWHASTLPCFTLWKNQGGLADGYVTGLEPATNYPNPRSFESEQDRVVPLAAGESVEFSLQLEHLAGSAVAAEAEAIRSQASAPLVHAEPKPGWSAN